MPRFRLSAPAMMAAVAFATLSLNTAALAGTAPADLAKAAKAVFTKNCTKCHGATSQGEAGIRYIDDLAALVAHKKVKPGDPDHSRIYQVLRDDEMPPDTETIRPSAADAETVRQWIAAGAPDVAAAPAAGHLLSFSALESLMLADLTAVPENQRATTRYLSLAYLLGAKSETDQAPLADAATLKLYQNAVAKLLNSLSNLGFKIVPETLVAGSFGTLIRFNLSDYGIDPALWNEFAAEDPYYLAPVSPAGQSLAQTTGTEHPVVRADWFTETASVPPFYNRFLQFGRSMNEVGRQFGVDIDGDVSSGRILRAGFADSGVSINNRLIERHDAPFGAFWVSYDFKSSIDQQNLFAFPLGPERLLTTGRHGFIQNGGEVIFNLRNGLQAYLLVNADGNILDKAPLEIVSDPSRPDRAVVNGLSCMGCHAEGIKAKADQVRPHVISDRASFDPADVNTVVSQYPAPDFLQKFYDQDAQRFQAATKALGIDPAKDEPIKALALRFESDVNPATAAAEAGLTIADFKSRLLGSDSLRQSLGALLLPEGLVKRAVYANAYASLVSGLSLGNGGGGVPTGIQTTTGAATCFVNIVGSGFTREISATSEISPDDATAKAIAECQKFVAGLPSYRCELSNKTCTPVGPTKASL